MSKKLISIILAISMLASLVTVPAFAELTSIKEEKYADLNQVFTPLDLTGIANMGFADEVEGDGKGGWTDQGEINDMRNFDLFGEQYIQGVKFNIIDPKKNGGKAVVTLRGQNLETIPNEVEIQVGQKGAGVYFLHASAWVQSNIATYSFVYEDGSTFDQPIRNQIENFNFWGTGSSSVAKTAWTGSNNSTTQVSIFLYAMENPYPEKKIEKLVCKTSGSGSFDMIVAATLTDRGPYLMEANDIGNVDMSQWYKYEMPTYDTLVGTPLDASHLFDAPAGKHGYLQADGDRLVFEDGTVANFWGVDVSKDVLVSNNRIDKLVDRLAACGFNLVRIHKTDGVDNDATESMWAGQPGRDVSRLRLNQLSYFIYKLKEKGMYLYLDLQVNRKYNENDNTKTGIGGAFWIDEENGWRIDEEYITQVLGYHNPYTGMTIGEDPTVCFIDLKNENNPITMGKSSVGEYAGLMEEKWNNWLIDKYGDDETLRKAWTYGGKVGLNEGESLTDKSVRYHYAGERSQIVRPRAEDGYHFSADFVTRYYEHMKAFMADLGFKGLSTAVTLWGSAYPTFMYGLSSGGIIDAHNYWSHPSVSYNLMQAGTTNGSNPAISMLEDPKFGYMGKFAVQKLYGKPLTITEWDECDLNPTMCEGYTLMAAYSAYQDWSPMAFSFGGGDEITEMKWDDLSRRDGNYKNNSGDPNALVGFWAHSNNPCKMGCMTAAAYIKYRDVQKGKKGFYIRHSQNDYFNPNAQNDPIDPWYVMNGLTAIAQDVTEYDDSINDDEILYRAYMAKTYGTASVSDTGEMRTDLTNGTFELNTAGSQAVIGRLSGKKMETDDMIVTDISNPFVTLNLTSITDEPIWNSDKLLITAAGDARNTDQKRTNDGLTITVGGTAPILVEQIQGKVTLKTKDDLAIYRLSAGGERIGPAMTSKDENGYTVLHMTVDDTCMNYEVVRTNKAEVRGANKHIVYEQPEYKPLFNDTEGYDWAKRKIERVVMTENMSGVSETTFEPGANITKGDFTAAVVKACKLKINAEDNFADVDVNDANYTSIGIAKQLGVVNGDENGNFNPDAAISRQDAMAILWRGIKAGGVKFDEAKGNELNAYRDGADVADYAKTSVEKALAQGYVKDLFSGASFNPTQPLTRAEAACICYGILWE